MLINRTAFSVTGNNLFPYLEDESQYPTGMARSNACRRLSKTPTVGFPCRYLTIPDLDSKYELSSVICY
jgi:hypothetical protein